MLPKHRRIRRPAEFTSVVRSGARAACPTVVVHVSATGDGPSRAGLVVGRAVGGAVLRNRTARRLRAILSHLLDDLPDGTLVVVRALPPAAVAGSSQLRCDVSSAVSRGVKRLGQRPRALGVVSS